MSGRRARRAAARIDVPVPFSLAEFADRLRSAHPRPIHVTPAVIGAEGVSGIWFRTAAADHIVCEQQTSAFHQAHIVAHLAAKLLLGTEDGAAIDPRLAPDLSPVTFGPGRSTDTEADVFASIVLERAGLLTVHEPGPAHWLGEVEPLWAALRAAVPQAAPAARGSRRPGAGLRLYRQVIEIRDAQLALRPYTDPAFAAAARASAHSGGLEGVDLDAMVEAATLAAATWAKQAGRRARWQPRDAVPGGTDLAGEAYWLAHVSFAFADLPQAGDLALGDVLAAAREGLAACWAQTPAQPLRISNCVLTVTVSQREARNPALPLWLEVCP